MTAPATDIITHLIGHSDHAGHCKHGIMTNGPGAFKRDDCTCGYSAVIADALDFLEGESDGE